MDSENSLHPLYIMSLPWNDRFSYNTVIKSIMRIAENPTITRKQLDELIDFKRSGDVDVYEFLQMPYISKKKPNGYKPALNLCYKNSKTKYLELTEISRKILEVNSIEERIQILFLITSIYYPHIRALLETLFSNKIYFKTKKKNSFPAELKRYFILPENKNLEEILIDKWNSNSNEFLKQIMLNPPVFDIIKINLKSNDYKKIKLNSIDDIIFSENDFKNNVFNVRTSKACVNLLGLKNYETRSVLFDYYLEKDNLYSIKIKESIIYLKFLNFSMRNLLSPDITPSILEAIDKSIIENYSLNTFYTLQEIMFDLEELGFKESEILDWKLNIEKNQKSNNLFESVLLKIKTKSGVMGSLGLKNKTLHAKLKFLKKEI